MSAIGGDRFELLRQVGEGGFGVVYQARDTLDGSTVAVKVLNAPEQPGSSRFEREAELLAELTHPSIVRYVAHGRTPAGNGYLAMEWLEGCTLEERLQAGPLTVVEVVALAQRIVQGLAVAAQKAVVHRDIKPANLFLPGRQLEAAKILDFGLARRVEDSQSITRTGLAIGTPLYMSPEQARGERGLDARSDVFSLGSVLYESLCGAPPFEGTSAFATLAKICLKEPDPIATMRRGVAPALAALIHAMLAKAPAERPAYPAILSALEALARESGSVHDVAAAPGHTLADDDRSAASSGRRALRARGQQRVLCALFVGPEHAPPELEQKLRALFASHGVRVEHLLDGSRIVLVEQQPAAMEQAVAAARCALALRLLLKSAPIVVCTGRAVVDGKLPVGDLIERGAGMLADAVPGVVRVDEASAGLLDARFEIRGEVGQHTLEGERSGGEAPRTLLGQVTPFVGRDRELGQLELIFRESVDEGIARAVLITAPAGGGKSRLRYELRAAPAQHAASPSSY